MITKTEEFEVLVPNLDGTDIAERVKVSIPIEWDEEIKEWLLTPEAHQIIEDTKARHMGLLLPAEIKELRERHGYTQKEMGELFQVGEKSWTRWESGKHRPSRSINLLIRALYEGEISINYLLKRAGKPPVAAKSQLASEWVSKAWQVFSESNQSHSGPSWEMSTDPIKLSKVVNAVIVQSISPSGKSDFLSHFLKLVEQQSGSTENRFSYQVMRMPQRFNRLAPTHNYAQPRLTTPTEA